MNPFAEGPGVILWMGPVQKSDLLATFTPPEGWSVLTIGSQVARGEAASNPGLGVTPTDFRVWAAAKLGSDPFGALLTMAKKERAVIASYSAGHGLAEILMEASADDPRLRGVALADSYYGLDVHPGSYAYGRAALVDGRPFWLTTSNSYKLPHTPHSGEQSVGPLATALSLEPLLVTPASMPEPQHAEGRGSVLWLDYAGRTTHQAQVPMAGRMLSAWAAGSAPSFGSGRPESGPGTGLLLVGGLLTLVLLATRRKG